MMMEKAGPLGAIIGLTLGGLAMLVIAKSYGYMVQKVPVSGGEFAYAYNGFGRYHAYVCGWLLTLGYLSIVPLNATALSLLAKFIAPDLFTTGYLYSLVADVKKTPNQCCLRQTSCTVTMRQNKELDQTP